MPRFGLHLTSFGPPSDPSEQLFPRVLALAETMERSGFDSLWLTDHLRNLGPEGPAPPMPEAYTLLSAIAARTEKLRLGVLATSVTYRNPALLAKMMTTLDVISGGRVILGIGAGHPRTEAEQRSCGFEFPPIGERMSRLEEALQIIRAMFAQQAAAWAGRHYAVHEAFNAPRPIQPGGPPILVAGSGELRLLRLAAKYGEMCNLSFPSGDTLDTLPHKLEVLRRHCQAVGRDAAEIRVTYKALLAVADAEVEAQRLWAAYRDARGLPDFGPRAGVFVGTPATVAAQARQFVEAGVDALIFEMPDAYDLAHIEAAGQALMQACN
ncbi:MAG TPA: TIGR03560 family F420-dependent LLM class oxidoreductase [Chloroflexota bacterium]|nr:TIGR03560 family F420-dependent LLM class oxidoreductase [Chloroflexota bacterium]